MQKSHWWNGATGLLLVLVCLSTVRLAWAAEPLVLTPKDSGKTLTLTVGQRLRVDLDLGAGHYVLAPEFDPAVLALMGQSMESTSGPKGSSSRVVYEFLVRQGGQTELVISAKSSGSTGKKEPLLKVKIIATGGGEQV
jgi:hypothetical protein